MSDQTVQGFYNTKPYIIIYLFRLAMLYTSFTLDLRRVVRTLCHASCTRSRIGHINVHIYLGRFVLVDWIISTTYLYESCGSCLIKLFRPLMVLNFGLS